MVGVGVTKVHLSMGVGTRVFLEVFRLATLDLRRSGKRNFGGYSTLTLLGPGTQIGNPTYTDLT